MNNFEENFLNQYEGAYSDPVTSEYVANLSDGIAELQHKITDNNQYVRLTIEEHNCIQNLYNVLEDVRSELDFIFHCMTPNDN